MFVLELLLETIDLMLHCPSQYTKKYLAERIWHRLYDLNETPKVHQSFQV